MYTSRGSKRVCSCTTVLDYAQYARFVRISSCLRSFFLSGVCTGGPNSHFESISVTVENPVASPVEFRKTQLRSTRVVSRFQQTEQRCVVIFIDCIKLNVQNILYAEMREQKLFRILIICTRIRQQCEIKF